MRASILHRSLRLCMYQQQSVVLTTLAWLRKDCCARHGAGNRLESDRSLFFLPSLRFQRSLWLMGLLAPICCQAAGMGNEQQSSSLDSLSYFAAHNFPCLPVMAF